MPDQKISQLADGGAAQATDEFVVARAGANNKITGTNLAAGLASLGTTIVAQSDLGSAPNEVPLNQYLGTMAYQDAASVIVGDLTVSGTVLGRLLQNTRTLASYRWNLWNPSDLVGTSTNAGSSGTTDDSEFVTMVNASGTLTVTFDVAGSYMVCVSVATQHANAYSFEKLTTTFAGTATRRNNRDSTSVSGDPDGDTNLFAANCFYVSATVGQTLTLLPSYELTGSGTTANHEARCNITVQYCGG